MVTLDEVDEAELRAIFLKLNPDEVEELDEEAELFVRQELFKREVAGPWWNLNTSNEMR